MHRGPLPTVSSIHMLWMLGDMCAAKSRALIP
jgi:hypothetical protein